MVISPWPSSWRGGFPAAAMRLLEPKLGRVLDGDHALARVDHLRQGVEHRGLTGAGTARDDDVRAACAGDLEHVAIFSDIDPKPRIMSSVIGFSENLRIEMAVPRKLQRRNDNVDAAAVVKAGVDQRGGLVDAAADLVRDPLGDLEQMLLVAKLTGRSRACLALDVRSARGR